MGCQDPEIITDVNINPDIALSNTGVKTDNPLAMVDVRATTHLFPRETIIAATIAPKSGMRTFSSQILLLSDTGKIYGSTTAFPQLELITAGPYTAISGFYLEDNRSGFFARDDEGLTAFIDGGEKGFEEIGLSTLQPNLKFCEATLHAPGQTIMATETDSIPFFLSQDTENGQNTLTLIGNKTNEKEISCGQGRHFILPAFATTNASMEEKSAEQITDQIASSETVSTEVTKQGLVLTLGDQRRVIKIVDGLSIDGIESPEWIYTTSQPLGNTFNSGVTLIRGDGSNRIVMVANDYLGRTVFGEKIDP